MPVFRSVFSHLRNLTKFSIIGVIPEKEGSYKKYISSDESIITVDQQGNIMAVNNGNTVVTVESESAAVSASCLVQVSESAADTSKLSDISGVLYNANGSKLQNTPVLISADNLSQNSYTDENGRFSFNQIPQGSYVLTVTGVSTNILINSADVSFSCILTDNALAVLYGTNSITAGSIRDIKLIQNNIKMTSGETYDIAAVLTPSDAKDQKLIYRSEDPNVADVDNTGRITALNEGGTIIYVSSQDGTVSDKMTDDIPPGGD